MSQVSWTGEARQGHPFWWDALEDIACDAAPPARCDVLVIGAGYTGLSAALTAQACGARVAVVEAAEPGKGASTRNGGMFGAHPRLSWDALAARFGVQTADDIFAEAAPANDWTRALIERERIACDLHQTGRVQLAWTAAHFEGQKRLARHIREKTTVKVEVLEREALGREINTECYFGGLVLPEHSGLHPAKFHQGLLRAVLRRGIAVSGGTEVKALEREGVGFVAKTARGVVRSDKVILATNGYTGPAFRHYARRIFALPSYLIATEELPANLIGHLAPGRRMMVETRARHSYFRVSPDGKRILFGGRAAMTPIDLQTAARRLRKTMCEVWPELADAKLSHVWTGSTGYSFAHTPNVGEDRGLHHAMGFSGSGTVMAPYLGAKAAYRAMGDPNGETAYARTTFNASWLHPFAKPHFLKAADFWYHNWVDRWENRQRRPGKPAGK